MLCALTSATANGQFFERSLVIRGARIVTMTGPAVEEGTIIAKGGRITALGTDVKVPFLARTVDGAGKTVTPGFIDAWSALGRFPNVASKDPTARAWDAFDRYDRDAIRDAWRHGVTTVYIGGSGEAGITGMGAVVRLSSDDNGGIGSTVEPEATLCINLDSGASPISRLKTFRAIRKQFRDALKYRESLEDYEEDLKEYLEKLEERNKKNGKKEDEVGKEDEKKDDKPSEEEGEKPKPEEKPTPEPSPEPEPKPEEDEKSVRAGFADSNGNGKNGDEKKETKDGEGEEDEKEDELEKPEEPEPDRAADVLLRAIDHELPVRVTAHRSADILNAVALAEEFNLDFVLEGATEAHLVAELLADAEIPVVLGVMARSGAHRDDQYRRHAADAGDLLSQAGVRWTVSSGGHSASAGRFVSLNAQLAAMHNREASDWMRLVTTDAASILGLSRRFGRLMPGAAADFVVWSGDPVDPSSIVELVVVGGKEVYRAGKDAGGIR